MKKVFLFPSLFLFLGTITLSAQNFSRDTSIRVLIGNQPLKNPWAGGHNFTQLSATDLNFDGIKDLVVFDQTGTNYDKITTYINTGTPNQVAYVHAPQYEKKFPKVHKWMLLVDYNCDGMEDLFTYNQGDFSAYKNTSSNGNLQFTLDKAIVLAEYQGNPNQIMPLYSGALDMPAFSDVNNDGDIDVLAFDFSGLKVYYFENLSMERYGVCDSLDLYEYSSCWGHFTGNANNNILNLQTCSGDSAFMHPPDQRSLNGPQSQHTGNCLICLDMDSDVDMDMITGSLNYCNMVQLTNGFDSSVAEMVTQDINFPSTNVPVNQLQHPCPYHLDVNNDGKRDLLVSPFAPNISVDKRSITWYKNTGTDLNPVFSFQQDNFLQDNEIEVGEGAYPVFFDIDADGLTDLLVGNMLVLSGTNCISNTLSSVTAYKNIGTATVPKFQFVTSDYASISSSSPGWNLMPAFGDVDNDGDADMVVGDASGNLHYYLNTAAVSYPASFTLQTPLCMVDASSTVIDVGSYAAPQLFDMDQDGLTDIVCGERSGKLYYYRNTGTSTSPSFTLINNFLGNVDVQSACCGGYSTPTLLLDSGNIEMYLGSESGVIYHYTNISNNLNGTFTLADSILGTPTGIWEGPRTAVTVKDITNDGLPDMVVGNYRGGTAFYGGIVPSSVGSFAAEGAQIALYPNPAGNKVTLKLDGINGNAGIKLFNMLGAEVFFGNTLGRSLIDLDTELLADGVYLCRITTTNSTFTKKLVVRH